MGYNVDEYVLGCRFNGLQDGETMVDLSQTDFVRSSIDAFQRTNTQIHTNTRTHTYGHTPTNAIGENAMRCISLKIKL